MRQITSSTLSNQSLATALLCHTYTADADRMLFIRLFADQVAGNGAYSSYITIQRLGTGSAYEVQPRTAPTVASGITSIAFTTIPVPVKNTDVVKVYLVGLAGDTTTPDIITEIWEDETAITATTIATYVDTEVAAIKAKTDNLPSDPASAGTIATSFSSISSTLTTIASYIDTEVAAIKAKTDNLPSDPADASDIAASFSTVNSTLATIASYIDTEVAAIKAKTDNLPSDPADASDIAASFGTITSTLATIAGYIDTEVAAIKAKTDNLPSDPSSASTIATSFGAITATLSTIASYIDTEVAAIKAKTDNLPSDPADASDIAAALTAISGYIDTEVAAIKAKTDNLPNDPASSANVTSSTSALSALINALNALLGTPAGDSIADDIANISAGTGPTAVEIRQEMDGHSTQLAKLGTPVHGSLADDIANISGGGGGGGGGSTAEDNWTYGDRTLTSYGPAGGTPYTYTLRDSVTNAPVANAVIWIATEQSIANVVWYGVTDAFGVARDVNGNVPKLTPGTFYILARRVGFTDAIDVEVIT